MLMLIIRRNCGRKRRTALARRASKTATESNETRKRVAVPERDYFPLDGEMAGSPAATAIDRTADPNKQPAKPSMEDVFGPGGLLERCMIGGYEHRRAQLQMAERVQDALASKHHVIVEAGTGTGKTLAYLI